MWGREKVNVSIFHRWLFSRLDVTAYVRTFTYMYIYMTHTICVWKGYSPYSLTTSMPFLFHFYLYTHINSYSFIHSTFLQQQWFDIEMRRNFSFHFSRILRNKLPILCLCLWKRIFFFVPLQSFKIYEFFLLFLPSFEYTNLRLRS